MNIAKILKNCPEGTKLYSPIFGELELVYIKDNSPYSISCREIRQDGTAVIRGFTKDGKMLATDAEPTLFPSKDKRSWKVITISQFKPFDKVLVRDSSYEMWKCDFFEHKVNNSARCIRGTWNFCIPYEGNEHLVGTDKKPEQ